LQQRLVLPAPKDIGEYFAGQVIQRPHSHRGRRLQPTNDYISSNSACCTLRTTTIGRDPSLAVSTAGFTD
jgi:hypothetical protein